MNSVSQSINGRGARRGAFALISVCFLLSGFAALLYETVWLRQFAIILGTSEQALAVILASYMGGLSAGAWVASKRIDRIRHPLWVYGALEGGIALCALAMPYGLRCVELLQVQFFGGVEEPPAAGSPSQLLFGLASSAVLILPPTAMMGATLPLLAKQVVHRDREIGPRIGLLYGINTFGAVAGTLAAAFLLLPSLGLRNTTWVGAAINLGIFAIIILLARRGIFSPGEARAEEVEAVKESPVAADLDARYRLVVWFAAAAGAVAFCYEIIFTRMLSHVLGGSIYAFATMLAGFLLGIALGGTIFSRLAIRRDRAVVALVYAQCLSGVSSLMAYHLIDSVAGWTLADWGGRSATTSQVVVSILILLPTAVFMGATFPLATRIFARNQSDAAAGSARVYFFNTTGGIAGALCTGIVLLPHFAYRDSTFIAILANLGLALLMVLVMRARPIHFAIGLTAFLALICFRPDVPQQLMRASPLDTVQTKGELIFSRVGRSGTVALFDQLGEVRFMTNGLPESIVARHDSIDPFSSSGAWLSVLPPLLRDECESMLIIGLGGGVAAAHAPPSVDEIDVFELEPAVVEANRYIARRRSNDPLADERVDVILNDGRNGLALTSKKYDAIVSQPSHPWTAGASHLFTREFAQTAKNSLRPGGVFLQWMNVDFVDPDLLRSLSATLLDVFPHVRVYEPSPDNVLFVASEQPIRPEATESANLELNLQDRVYYDQFGIRTATHLFALLRFDEQSLRELAGGATFISDEHNLLAMQSPLLLGRQDKERMKRFLAEHSVFRLSQNRLRELCPTVDPVVLGSRLFLRTGEFGSEQVRALCRDPAEAKLYDAVMAKKTGDEARWAKLLLEMANEHPSDSRPALLLLGHRQLGSQIPIDEESAEELRTHLDDRHGELLEAIESLIRNDLAGVAERDETLASFSPDEVGYPLAVRMRLIWRVADVGPNRRQNNRDALRVIAQASPVVGSDAMVSFRVAAAINADQPTLALASVLKYAKGVVARIQQKSVQDVSTLQSMRNNLIKCRAMVGQDEAFRTVSKKEYAEAIEFLDKVIAGDV